MVLASWKIICNRDWKEVGACTDGRSIKVVERKSVLASMETQLRPVGEKKWCLHHGNSTTKFVVGHEGCLHLFVSENEPVVNEAVACNCGMNRTVVTEVVACNCGMNCTVGVRGKWLATTFKPTQSGENGKVSADPVLLETGGFSRLAEEINQTGLRDGIWIATIGQ